MEVLESLNLHLQCQAKCFRVQNQKKVEHKLILFPSINSFCSQDIGGVKYVGLEQKLSWMNFFIVITRQLFWWLHNGSKHWNRWVMKVETLTVHTTVMKRFAIYALIFSYVFAKKYLFYDTWNQEVALKLSNCVEFNL